MKDDITVMCFDDWLVEALEKPVSDDYDSGGNSDRAVVTRGIYKEITWQYKVYPKRIKLEFSCFDWMETEIGWFIQLPLMIFLAPILPFLAASHWHKKALASYKLEYERYLNKFF